MSSFVLRFFVAMLMLLLRIFSLLDCSDSALGKVGAIFLLVCVIGELGIYKALPTPTLCCI